MLPFDTIRGILERFGNLGLTDMKDSRKAVQPQITVHPFHDSSDSKKPVVIDSVDSVESFTVEHLQPKFAPDPNVGPMPGDCGDIAHRRTIAETECLKLFSIQYRKPDLPRGRVAKPHAPETVGELNVGTSG